MDADSRKEPIPANEAQSFSALMEQVRQGSQDAAEQIWRQYGRYVLIVVRRSVDQRMRTLLDSQDFSQAVWGSFFCNLPDVSQIDSPESLIKLLTKMARRKVVQEHRRLHRKQRDRGRDEELTEETDKIDERLPTPSQVAVAGEIVEELQGLSAAKSSKCERVVQMALDGYSAAQIADRERITERSVHRMLSDVKHRFLQLWSGRRD